ncbi:class I SAM-dependent methyltransferase [soil metagenome]|jgi:SAM-dependent methyltransferase
MTSDAGAASPTLPPLSIRAWLRFDFIHRILGQRRPANILEVGCGQGALGARLATYATYLGVEPDKASFSVAQQRVSAFGGTVINGTDEAIEPGEQFDMVCAFEVLEHIEHDEDALASWVQRIRPGGCLLISVPAWQDRFGPMDENVGHFRRYSPDELSRKLVAAGLSSPEVHLYGWPLGFALEAVRNRIDSKRLARANAQGSSTADLTAASGRTFQPPNPRVGKTVQLATGPFRLLQRLRPSSGIGMVAVATRN